MINTKLISFDLKAEFGFLKKPDINDGIYLSYNMLHKPALLGILGAIIGKQGYQKNGEMPEYYKLLSHLMVGIKPLNSDKGTFMKEILSYNNSTGFASSEAGGNLIITEQILINPSYRCFILLDINSNDENSLFESIKNRCAVYLPYLGKNDFSLWWDNFKEYDYEEYDFSTDYRIDSIFSKTEAVSSNIVRTMSRYERDEEPPWLYFERLPIGFDKKLYQYSYADFVYSNAKFKKDMNMSKAGKFYIIDKESIIQLF